MDDFNKRLEKLNQKANNDLIDFLRTELYFAFKLEKDIEDFPEGKVEAILDSLYKTIFNLDNIAKLEMEANPVLQLVIEESIQHELQNLLLEISPELKIKKLNTINLSLFYKKKVYPIEQRDKTFAKNLKKELLETVDRCVCDYPF